MLWTSGSGKWRAVRFVVPARPVEQGGPGGTVVSAHLDYAGTTWGVFALSDGRLIGHAPRMVCGRRVNTGRPSIAPLCAGPLGVRYYDLTPFAAHFPPVA